MLSGQTQLYRAGFLFDRVVTDVGQLRAKAEGAHRGLVEASQLQERLTGDKIRLEA